MVEGNCTVVDPFVCTYRLDQTIRAVSSSEIPVLSAVIAEIRFIADVCFIDTSIEDKYLLNK